LLSIKFNTDESVYTSKIYQISGNLTKNNVEIIAKNVLANDIIQQWKLYNGNAWNSKKGIGITIPRVKIDKKPFIKIFNG